MSVYTVKGVKYHRGHEGESLAQCGLYRDGVKVADYNDGDWGGECQFIWADWKAPKVTRSVVPSYSNVQTPVEIRVTPEEGLLWDHVAGKTTDLNRGMGGVEPQMIPLTPDLFVEDLIADAKVQRRIVREAKKSTLYRLEGDPEGTYWPIKHKFDLPVKEYLTDKYGARLVEIINETLGQVALPRGAAT